MAAPAAPASRPAGRTGSADLSGAYLDAGVPASEPVDVNGLPRAALLDALRLHAGMKGMPEAVKERIAALSPFDSVADMTSRVNASATSMRDRLGKAFLPFLRVTTPLCQPRVDFSPAGSLPGGVPASNVPEIARVTSSSVTGRSVGGVH